jgi:uncharacterized protein with von Willebrand factor type A (vWA) domain
MKHKTLIILFLVIFTAGCESGPPPVSTVPKAQAQVQTQTKPIMSDPAPVQQKVWPFLTGQPENAKLAGRLTEKNFVFVFDGSGSMGDSACGNGRPRVEPAKRAAIEWSKSVPSDANIGLIAFHYKGWTHLLPSKDRQAFVNAIQKIEAGGNTPLASAFRDAYEDLTRQAQAQLGYGEYTIVTTTDGEADSIQALSKWVDYILQVSPIQIYTIGFCIKSNHTLNQPMKTTYKSANEPGELAKGLREVLAEAPDFDVASFR